MQTIIETYDGVIAQMRRSGSTLAEIGNAVGVTRERIRQILNQYYGGTQMTCLTENNLARVLGCNTNRLVKLRQQGKLNPRHTSSLYIYDQREAEKAMLAIQKFCIHCGEPMPKYMKVYCAACSAEKRRYPYPFFSEDVKKRCREAARNWQDAHPNRYKETCDKAMRKYQLKCRQEHFANTEYIVVKGDALPMGSIIRAIGFKNWHLILENGSRISVNNIRKITEEAKR